MKYRFALLIFLIGFILQSTLSIITEVNITPNIILCAVILLSFLYEGYQGLVFGILFGLVQDLSFALIIGPSAIVYLIIALLMAEIRRYLYRDSFLNILLASVLGTVIYYLGSWCIITLFGGIYSLLFILEKVPYLIVYHFGIMAVFYLLVGRRIIRFPQDKYYKGIKFLYKQ